MKISSSLLVLAAAVSFYSCGKQEPNNPDRIVSDGNKVLNQEQFSKYVFQSLKYQDFDAYSQYFIRLGDLDYFFAMKVKHQKKMKKDPQKIKRLQQQLAKARALFPARRKSRLSGLQTAFNRLRSEAEAAGVDWKTARYKGYQLENARHIYKIATADIIVTFTSGKKHYIFKIPRSQYLQRGWVYSAPLKWMGDYR